MNEKERYKKLVDEIKSTVKRGENPITNEQIADELDYSRKHFQRLYTGDGVIKEKHIKALLLHFPDVKENITGMESHVNEVDERYKAGHKKNIGNTETSVQVARLIDSTHKLSDSILISERNIERLIAMMEANYDVHKRTSLITDPLFSKVVDLLWTVAQATGKWKENQFRAMVAHLFEEGVHST